MLTPEGVSSNMVLENIDPNEAVAILVQGSERLTKEIYNKAELQITKDEKGNN